MGNEHRIESPQAVESTENIAAENLRQDTREESGDRDRETRDQERETRQDEMEQQGGLDCNANCPLDGQSAGDAAMQARQVTMAGRDGKNRYLTVKNTEDGRTITRDRNSGDQIEHNEQDHSDTVRDRDGHRRARVERGDDETKIEVGERGDTKITRNNRTGETTFENTETGVTTTVNGNDVKMTDKDGNVIFQGTKQELREKIAAEAAKENNPDAPDGDGDGGDNNGDGTNKPKENPYKGIEVDKDGNITVDGKDGDKIKLDKDNNLSVKDKDGKDILDLNKKGDLSFLGGLALSSDGGWTSVAEAVEPAQDPAEASATVAMQTAMDMIARISSSGIVPGDCISRLSAISGQLTGQIASLTVAGNLDAVAECLNARGMVDSALGMAQQLTHNQDVLKQLAGVTDPAVALNAMKDKVDPVALGLKMKAEAA